MTTNMIRKTEFARHVVKFHPEYKTIHLASKNKQTNTGRQFWADPEGYTWWESEEELKKAQKIRSTQENPHANNVKMMDPRNPATSKIPIAKMKLVEGEVNEKQEDIQCLLCTRIWRGHDAKYRIQSHVHNYHTVPIVIQHSNIKRKSRDYLKLCRRSENGIDFILSKIAIEAGQATLIEEIEPSDDQNDLSQEYKCDYQINAAEVPSTIGHQGDSGHTNSDKKEQKQPKQIQSTTIKNQDEPSATS